MFVLALTGGIGSGKSEAAAYFASRGAIVLDLDAIAKPLLDTQRVRDALVSAFGEGVIGADGRVDHAALAAAAFASDEAARRLDDIVHPEVLREVMTGLEQLELLEMPPRVAVLEVPLLVEAPALGELADVVLALEAPAEVRIERSVGRGLAEADVRARLARQASDEQRAAIADAVIANTGTLEGLRAELAAFWEREVALGAS